MDFFTSDDQKKLYEILKNLDLEFANIFYSALLVLDQKNIPQTQIADSDLDIRGNEHPKNIIVNPDRFAQSAHSIRELLNILLRKTEITLLINSESTNIEKNRKTDKSKLTHVEKIQKFSNPLGGLPDYLQQPYKEIHKLHIWFINISHHGRKTSEHEYKKNLEKYIFLLKNILTSHFEIIEKINHLLNIRIPTKIDLKNLELLLSRNLQSYNYFFTHAKSNWLLILMDANKYFKNIPQVNNNSYELPIIPWPESQYLENIAAEKPEQVQKIISEIKMPKNNLEKNFTVLVNFTCAAIKMPPKFGKKIAEKAIKEKWHHVASNTLLEQSLTELMIKLAKEEFEISLQLCNSLLDIYYKDIEIIDIVKSFQMREIHSYIDQYHYEQIIKNNIIDLIIENHDFVIEMLAKKLKKIIYLKNKNLQNTNKVSDNDMSHIWRPAIEDHKQNGYHSLESLLVTGIRLALENAENLGVKNLEESLKILKSFNYQIFRRLEIYFYGKHPIDFLKEINLLSLGCFGIANFKHEYYHMLKNSFPYINNEIKQKLREIICNGPDFNRFSGNEQEFKTYKNYWLIEHLSPIIEHLPEFKEKYDILIKKYGKSQLAEFNSIIEVDYPVAHPADLSTDMSIDKILKFIKSYKIPQNIFLEEDVNGLMFEELVEKKPIEYIKHTKELLMCHSLFQYKFLIALSKIKDKQLDWKCILTFCESIIELNIQNKILLDPILKYCAELLEKNLMHDKNGISFNLRKKVWNILRKSIDLASTDTMWSKDYPIKNFDAHGISINSSHGRITYAIMNYSIWCHNEFKNSKKTLTELVPEVKSLLNSLLIQQTQSISIHAVLGFNFFNLLVMDKNWAESNINLIFTHDEANIRAGQAAWDTYLLCKIYENSFNVLIDEYIYRIKNIPENKELNESQIRLAEHVGIIYLNDLDKNSKLLISSLNRNDSQLIDHILIWIGTALKKWNKLEVPKINISKLISYSKIQSNPNSGWLFLNPMMKKQERIKILRSILDETDGKITPIYWIPEELELFAKKYPLDTIYCIEKIIKYYGSQNTELYHMLSHLKKIFRSILESKHESAIKQMKRVANTLGTLGYDEFSEFG